MPLCKKQSAVTHRGKKKGEKERELSAKTGDKQQVLRISLGGKEKQRELIAQKKNGMKRREFHNNERSGGVG